MTPPSVTADFRVLVEWNGLEDKPFYRAMLLSASRAGDVGDEPFWGYAVIGRQELDRVVEAIEKTGREWHPGGYAGAGPEYYVLLESGSGVWNTSLGFDTTTLAGVNAMADALEPDHRKPLLDIVARIRRELGGAGPAAQ